MGDLVDNLKDAIKKSGFPLELAVHACLAERGWILRPNIQFLDPDEQKPRELDLHAIRRFDIGPKEEGHKHELEVYLAIEIKHSPSGAWVFFHPSVSSGDATPADDYPYSSISALLEFRHPLRKALLTWDDFEQHHYFTSQKRSRAFQEYFPPAGPPNKLYDAVNKVLKAVIALDGCDLAPIVGPAEGGGLLSVIQVYYPVIVCDGPLFTCTIEEGEPALAQVEQTQLVYEYPIPYGSGRLRLEPFILDVVRLNAVDGFLQTIETEHAVLAQQLGEDIERFEQALTVGQDSYGQPLDSTWRG